MSKATDLFKVMQEAEPAMEPKPKPTIIGKAPAADKPLDAPADQAVPKPTPGGLLFRMDLSPADYKSQTRSLQQITIVKDKKNSAQFELFRNPEQNEFQLFHLFFDKKAFLSANTNAERAQVIKYVGAFKSKEAAIKFLKTEAANTQPVDKSPVGTPGWSRGQLGF